MNFTGVFALSVAGTNPVDDNRCEWNLQRSNSELILTEFLRQTSLRAFHPVRLMNGEIYCLTSRGWLASISHDFSGSVHEEAENIDK